MSTRALWFERVAHDLRGPLSPLQTAVHLLRCPAMDAGQRDELLALVDRQVQRLAGMIDEFSDLVLAEKGGLVASRETIDVGLLVADVVARYPARPPHVEFAPGAEALELEGDGRRVAQLFRALLGLRLSRYDDAIPVQARIERGRGRMRMACRVKCHIASDAMIASLLASPHPDPPEDALGLDLVIAAAIARAHGGSLHGHADAGGAVQLVLELPARPG